MKKRDRKPPEKPASAFLDHIYRFSTDAACREFLEKRRWPDGPVCPRCGGKRFYELNGMSTRPGVRKCASCRKPYTVTVGTIFEDTHIPLPKWFAAIYLMMSSKKGISAHQVHRMLGVAYRSAWFMCHRIRWAFRTRKPRKTLRGKVEVDETYIGGKYVGKTGRGTPNKTAVLGIVQRGKKARLIPTLSVTKPILHRLIRENVYDRSHIMTDEFISYLGLRKRYQHSTVNHSKKEYARGDVTTNSAESLFALLKRGIHGVFHQVSRNRLALYCDEFAFRYGHRKVSDQRRFEHVFDDVGGRVEWYIDSPRRSREDTDEDHE